jgi:histidinol-phosphate aminotransferase
VLLTRTFSKAYGLAGFRVGYAVAQLDLARELARAGVPYAVCSAAEAAALQVLAEPARLQYNVRRVLAERSKLADGLRRLDINVVEGQGNFVWVPLEGSRATRIAKHLAESGVVVQPFPGHGVRISVGTPAQTEQALRTWQRQRAFVLEPAGFP